MKDDLYNGSRLTAHGELYSKLFNNPFYLEDVKLVANLDYDWSKLKDKTVLISGASGLIGSFLVDVLMFRNINNSMNCKIFALGRNEERAHERFIDYWDKDEFKFIAHDVNEPFKNFTNTNFDYIFHLASNTHPKFYSLYPVETIITNILGLNNLLNLAVKNNTKRFLFTSSVEVYGESRGDTEFFDENYCGCINISKARSGYNESKRCGETLCLSYLQQYGLDVVIPRLPRTYGATMLNDDSKATAQFFKKALAHEDIILKSDGKQFFSFMYVADAVSGILKIFFNGATGEAYNIADEKSDIMLKDFAKLVADYANQKVIFDIPDAIEKAGYSMSTKARLNSSKLKMLGWKSYFDIQTGIKRTLDILSN